MRSDAEGSPYHSRESGKIAHRGLSRSSQVSGAADCMIQVAVANEQMDYPVDEALLRRAVTHVLRTHDYRQATISVAVVDNAAIHALNKQFLDHDYPTDVLSFLLDEDEEALDGEVV